MAAETADTCPGRALSWSVVGGLDICWTLPESLSTELFRALVWLANWLLASFTTVVAFICTCETADFRALVPSFLTSLALGVALTDASRLLSDAQ